MVIKRGGMEDQRRKNHYCNIKINVNWDFSPFCFALTLKKA